MSYNENMYIKVNNLKEGEEEKVKKVLDDNNIQYQTFDSSLGMFCWEEAAFRLRTMCDSRTPEEDVNSFIDHHQEALSELFYNEDIIDGDYSCDLTKHYIDDNVTDAEVENFIDKDLYTREEPLIIENRGEKAC